jgi:EAL domain-containing protein (putative c-di-GMP-specific phosphodiesterase class I)
LFRENALKAFSRIFAQNTDYLLWLNLETSTITRQTVGTGRLLSAVLDEGLQPHRVVIEIVESKASDPELLVDFVNKHREHGFYIAMDDVGAGHSNLERIAQLKPDVIKIDRFLIRNIEEEYHKQQVVNSLASLARGIGALVVAEGVETQDESLTLLDMGVNIHQGYLYAEPAVYPAAALADCAGRMEKLAGLFRLRRLARHRKKKATSAELTAAVKEIAQRLGFSGGEFDNMLRSEIHLDNRIECLYILDSNGIQVTDTVCDQAKFIRPHSRLFRPAERGADLSLKDYYLLIKAGLPQYVSDPYISRATGSACVTISIPFGTASGRRFIVCADFNKEIG